MSDERHKAANREEHISQCQHSRIFRIGQESETRDFEISRARIFLGGKSPTFAPQLGSYHQIGEPVLPHGL